MWPLSYLNANPVDHAVWCLIKSMVCETPHSNVDSLKSSVVREWGNIVRDFLVKSCTTFRPRIEVMVRVGTGDFENI